MAVLIEGISVVIKGTALDGFLDDDFENFKALVPNDTLSADLELACVSFRDPNDAFSFVHLLESLGLKHQDEAGNANDMVIVDQLQGPMEPCEWISFGSCESDGHQVNAARLIGSQQTRLMRPLDWTYEGSLSEESFFVPASNDGDSMKYVHTKDGVGSSKEFNADETE